MVRKKVKKSPEKAPARSKKVSKTKEVMAEYSVMEVGDLKSLLREMIGEALASKDTPTQSKATAPPTAGQTIGDQEAGIARPPNSALSEELEALFSRMMAAFGPEIQAMEKRFGYSNLYSGLCLQYLNYAVRSMAAACAVYDPRRKSGQPLWWDSRDGDAVKNALYSRLASEMSSIRQLAKVRKPEAFDAR